ncbi:MAG: succinylglutamate desuccinylase/aspartoacylase family protein [Planctomycetota bacterium]
MSEFKEPPVTNGYENVKQVKRVDALEMESLPTGKFSRMFIELVESGIGRPIQVPVVVARGKKDGPVFGITAALHGNELNGIPVIHKLLQRLNLKTLRGTIVCVIAANMPGLMTEQREFTDGQDLNHIMPGKPDGKISQVYAYNLVDRITQHFDFLVDLHTASEGRVNSLYVRADLKQAVTAQMAYLLRPQIIVHNPPSDYTLRGTVAEAGKPAITVEICDPQRFQHDPIARTVKGIRRILNHVEMIPSKASSIATSKTPMLCKKSYWILAKRGGMMRCIPKITDRVAEGEVIATQVNIFGDTIRDYVAPEEGIVIGHCVNPLGQTGARIIHLGVPMDESERAKFETISGCSLDGTFCNLHASESRMDP